MDITKLRIAVSKRIKLQPNDDDETEECWEEETWILSEDISGTLHFFETECTDEEFLWLSEVFEDISKKIQSEKFIQVLRNRLSRVTRESYNQKAFESEHIRKYVDYDEYIRSVGMEIDYAEGALEI